MPLILRAIITGFGYKLGSELARYIATRVGLVDKDQARKDSKDEVIPDGVTTVEDPVEQGERDEPEPDAREEPEA